VLRVAYDSGHANERMGCGPDALLPAVVHSCAEHDLELQIQDISHKVEFPTENAVAFAIMREVSSAVNGARTNGQFPIVLSGNCSAAVGAYAGLGGKRHVGVIWCDQHADLNTPETSISGFLDGMALAMISGRCWRASCDQVDGFEPVSDNNILLVGATELDFGEREILSRSGIKAVNPNCELAITLPANVRESYIHFDVDVLNTRANAYSTAQGVALGDLLRFLHRATEERPPLALSIASYDPSYDPNRVVEESARRLVSFVLARIGRVPTALVQ